MNPIKPEASGGQNSDLEDAKISLERQRLAALWRTGLVGSQPEARFDRITRLAAGMFSVPYALISFVDAERVWFKSRFGWQVEEAPRHTSLCSLAIEHGELLEIPDVSALSSQQNYQALLKSGVRYYAGALLRTKDGMALGSLCILDTTPRCLSETERQSLQDLADCAVTEIELTLEQRILEENDLFVSGPVAFLIWRSTAEWPLIYASKNCEAVLGYPADELLSANLPYINLIHPDDRIKLLRLAEINLNNGVDEYEQSYRLRMRDGKYRWYYSLTRLTRNESNDPDTLRCYLFDQTSQKESEQALQSERARLADVIYATRVGIWEWNLQTNSVRVSDRWAEIIGYSLTEMHPITVDTWTERVHPEDLAISLEQLEKCFRRELDNYDCDLRVKHKQGHWVWVHSSGKIISWTADGKPLIMTGTQADISEKKRSAKTLQDFHDFQQLIFENIPAYIFVKDKDFRIISANRRFIDLYPEQMRDKVIGYTTLEGYSPPEREEFLIEDRKAFREGSAETEESIRFPNGERHVLLTRKIRFENSEQQAFILGVSTDITELKKIQDLMGAARQTAELATKAKSQFLAKMSHEIRTPINGVLGMVGLAKQQSFDPEQRRRLELAEKSGTTLLNIVNNLLDFSKVEAGQLSIEEIDFDLLLLFSEIIETHALAAHGKQLEIILDATGIGQENVNGDPTRLRQILDNLLSNAIKFTSTGSIRVDAELRRTGQNLQLHCTVTDSGIGIEADALRQLFEPFTQADSSTTRKYGGTGLGLTIARQLCELMGGEISAISQPGAGSRFQFHINLQKSHDRSESKNETLGPPTDVLLVSVQDQLSEGLQRQLEAWNYRVSARRDFQSLTPGEINRYPLVFVDPQFAGELRNANPEGNTETDTPQHIVALSSQSNQTQCTTGAINAFLASPLTPAGLRRAINEQHSPPAEQIEKTDAQANQSTSKEGIILLVEDNFVNQEVVKAMLENAQFPVDIAENGRVALKKLQERDDINVILMDCQMPEMDGYEATHAIREGYGGKHYKQIPIIALTANSQPSDKAKCLATGMNDFLSKPIAPKTLIDTIHAHWPKDNKVIPLATAPSNTSQEMSWNRDDLLTKIGGKASRLPRLLSLFLQDCADVQAQLQQVNRQSNLDDLSNLLHRLKGSSGNLCCEVLYSMTKAAVNAAREKRWDIVEPLLPEIINELNEVTAAFNDYLEQSEPPQDKS